jgi:hypothetical protein
MRGLGDFAEPLFTLYDLLILVLLIAKATGGHEFNIA